MWGWRAYGSEIAKNNPRTLVFLTDISENIQEKKQKVVINYLFGVIYDRLLKIVPLTLYGVMVLHHTPNTLVRLVQLKNY